MSYQLITGDCRQGLAQLATGSVQTCISSPPYWNLRDYGVAGQIGLEPLPDCLAWARQEPPCGGCFVCSLRSVYGAELRRVLADNGTVFINLGDSYFGGGRGGNSDAITGRRKDASIISGRRGAHVQSCGTCDTAVSGSQARDYSSQNHDGEHTDFWWNHTAGTEIGHAPTPVHALFAQTQACTAALRAHLPSVDFGGQLLTEQFLSATLGLAHSAIRAAEQLRASLASMPAECVQQLLGFLMPADGLLAYQSSLHALAACVRRYADKVAADSSLPHYTAGTASPCEELRHHILSTAGYCSLLFSWLNTPYVQPQCTAEKANKQDISLKNKDLVGIPWRVALALQADGWILRQDIIWHKPNPMPESVCDRCTKAHEYIFLLSKKPKYYFNAEAIQESAIGGQHSAAMQFGRDGLSGTHIISGQAYAQHRPRGNRKSFRGGGVYTQGQSFDNHAAAANETHGNEPNESGLRNRRSVWTVATQPYAEAHFATFPPELIRPAVLAGTRPGDLVLDLFNGSGTTGQVALEEGRRYVGLELNPDYIKLTHKRLSKVQIRLQYNSQEGGVAA